MARDVSQPAVMQRAHERSRLNMEGKRTDNGDRCTLVAVCEISGTCALYPHGAAQLGVRITQSAAEKLVQASSSSFSTQSSSSPHPGYCSDRCGAGQIAELQIGAYVV